MPNSSIWPIDRTQSGANTQDQRGAGGDGNEEVLSIPQSSSITGASPSNCLMDTRWTRGLAGHSLDEGSYSSADM